MIACIHISIKLYFGIRNKRPQSIFPIGWLMKQPEGRFLQSNLPITIMFIISDVYLFMNNTSLFLKSHLELHWTLHVTLRDTGIHKSQHTCQKCAVLGKSHLLPNQNQGFADTVHTRYCTENTEPFTLYKLEFVISWLTREFAYERKLSERWAYIGCMNDNGI